MREQRIGVDESGKGDFFGPLVVAAVYVEPSYYPSLIGVRDSKRLKDERCLALDEVVRKVCPFVVVSIAPEKYNQLHESTTNLNDILGWAHARAIEDILSKVDCDYVISDQFADPQVLRSRLMERGQAVTVESRVRAEADLAVAAASVVARAEFIRQLEELGRGVGHTLPKGANQNVIDAGADIVRAQGKSVLRGIAKVHFRTVQDVLRRARSPK